ncbi:MAG: hypothetical protein AAGF26_07365 [Cyanobacteria bacterium P01_G01_bin.49]
MDNSGELPVFISNSFGARSESMQIFHSLLLVILLTGCFPSFSNTQSRPKTVSETSSNRSKLQDRITFIEQYVTFTRTYLKLEYSVVYHNNSVGVVPGPSDWDIRILAVVPASKIDQWIPTGALRTDQEQPKWLTTIPGSLSTNKITEWYIKGNSVIGIDRKTSTVAYRNSTIGD